MRKIVEILGGIWYRLKGWAKIIILGGLMIGYFAIKEFFEKRKRKGGAR